MAVEHPAYVELLGDHHVRSSHAASASASTSDCFRLCSNANRRSFSASVTGIDDFWSSEGYPPSDEVAISQNPDGLTDYELATNRLRARCVR